MLTNKGKGDQCQIEDAVWCLEDRIFKCHIHHPKLEFQLQLQASKAERDEARRTRTARRQKKWKEKKERETAQKKDAIVASFARVPSAPMPTQADQWKANRADPQWKGTPPIKF